jgi:hypothetical protein
MNDGRRSIKKRVAKATFGAALLFSAGSLLGGCGARDADPDADAGSDVIVDPRPDAPPDRTPDDARDGSVLPDAPLPDAPVPDVAPDVPSPRPDVLPDQSPDDARDGIELDAPLPQPDVPDADGRSCGPATRVWTPSSTMVRLRIAAVLPSPGAPLPPVPCVGPLAYEFTPGTRVLLQTGCLNYQSVHRSGVLSPAESQKLLTQVEKLESATCRRDTCRADEPSTTLTVFSGSCAERVYGGDDETGCGPALPPFVDFEELGRLSLSLRDAMAAVCSGYGDAIIGCRAPDPGSYGECGTRGDGGLDPAVASFHPILEAAPADVVVRPIPDGGDASPCVPALPVWNDESASFTMSVSKSGPGNDAGCGGRASYLFSKSMRTLSGYGCSPFSKERADVELTENQVNAIVAKLKELRTTCNLACSADPTTAQIAVEDCAGRVQGTYSSTEDLTCFGGGRSDPPYIEAIDLAALRGIFDDVVRSSCDDVDGGAGVCGALCRKLP